MEADCSRFTMGWAPGISTVYLPNDAAFAAGGGEGSFQYFSLQIHYENPTKLQNVVDTSGFKLWYTKELRKNDMGILFTGTTNLKIPGNTDSITTEGGGCPAECTRKFPSDIVVWNNGFHMHTLGRKISTRHIRDGVELEPFGTRLVESPLTSVCSVTNPSNVRLLQKLLQFQPPIRLLP